MSTINVYIFDSPTSIRNSLSSVAIVQWVMSKELIRTMWPQQLFRSTVNVATRILNTRLYFSYTKNDEDHIQQNISVVQAVDQGTIVTVSYTCINNGINYKKVNTRQVGNSK